MINLGEWIGNDAFLKYHIVSPIKVGEELTTEELLPRVKSLGFSIAKPRAISELGIPREILKNLKVLKLHTINPDHSEEALDCSGGGYAFFKPIPPLLFQPRKWTHEDSFLCTALDA